MTIKNTVFCCNQKMNFEIRNNLIRQKNENETVEDYFKSERVKIKWFMCCKCGFELELLKKNNEVLYLGDRSEKDWWTK